MILEPEFTGSSSSTLDPVAAMTQSAISSMLVGLISFPHGNLYNSLNHSLSKSSLVTGLTGGRSTEGCRVLGDGEPRERGDVLDLHELVQGDFVIPLGEIKIQHKGV